MLSDKRFKIFIIIGYSLTFVLYYLLIVMLVQWQSDKRQILESINNNNLSGVYNTIVYLNTSASYTYKMLIPSESSREIINIRIGIPVFIFIFLWPIFAALIYTVYRDKPRIEIVDIRSYSPPKDNNGNLLSPLAIGMLYDLKIKASDIIGELVYLGIKEIILIKENDRDKEQKSSSDISIYRGAKYDELAPNLYDYQIELIKGLGLTDYKYIKTNYLKDNLKYFNFRNLLINSLHKDLVKSGYFRDNLKNTKYTLFIFGFLFIIFSRNFEYITFLPGVLVILIGIFYPQLSQKGLLARQEIQGLKKYLTSQTDKFNYQIDNMILFESLLPYAISLELTNNFESKFKNVSTYSPKWINTDEPQTGSLQKSIDNLNYKINMEDKIKHSILKI